MSDWVKIVDGNGLSIEVRSENIQRIRQMSNGYRVVIIGVRDSTIDISNDECAKLRKALGITSPKKASAKSK